ncbi:M56 family metallopeptidase [Pedobacter borealis]|uniref:M56 family metallopeptidase n=1 Tax=Pedobacter borealis TaxID=475254 RepID=UPI001428D3E1|nr:M56 family metallopeptidase [Pedobacter borealis]
MVASQVMMTENLPLETYQPSIITIDHAIIAIYSLVTIAFLLKMLFNLSKIISMRKLPSVKLDNGVKLIDLKDSKIAFSFFNLLFLDPQLTEKNTILKHELVHIKQKHSLDVLLFEIIQIINWFNPIVYLVKKDIKLIHEYLADEETTKCDVEKYHYAMFLIQNSTGIQNLTLTNQIFSSSILKKRINMLNQKKSAHWAKLKLLVVLPITAGILCISTMAFTKDYGFVDLLPENLSGKIDQLDSTIIREILTKGELVVTNLNPIPNSKDSVNIEANTKDMFTVYLHNTKTGKSILELDWSLVPNGVNIKEGNYFKGTKEFSKIDTAINIAIQLKKTLATVKYGDLRKIELSDNQKLKSLSIKPDKVILPPHIVMQGKQLTLPVADSFKKQKKFPPPVLIERDTTKKKRSQEVIVQAYRTAMEAKRAQGSTDAKDKTIEIKPTPQSDKKLKEETIKAYEKAMGVKSDYKIYFGKLKLLIPKVEFNNLRSDKDYAGLILLANISNASLKIEKITTDCDFLELKTQSKTLIPNKNFSIDVVIRKALKGSISQKIFIYFTGQEAPIIVPVEGNFI